MRIQSWQYSVMPILSIFVLWKTRLLEWWHWRLIKDTWPVDIVGHYFNHNVCAFIFHFMYIAACCVVNYACLSLLIIQWTTHTWCFRRCCRCCFCCCFTCPSLVVFIFNDYKCCHLLNVHLCMDCKLTTTANSWNVTMGPSVRARALTPEQYVIAEDIMINKVRTYLISPLKFFIHCRLLSVRALAFTPEQYSVAEGIFYRKVPK